MKVKKVIVEIRPLKESLREFAEVFGKVKRGEKVVPKQKVSFNDIEGFRKFFSEKRMELLKVIKHRKPKSIYQLAKFVDRGYKNVYDDVELLEGLGLVTREKDNSVEVDFNKLQIDVPV
tara:strand:+ start:82 stop:438 length:357 start_codon:yes stop_codon:yes gene_type:complete